MLNFADNLQAVPTGIVGLSFAGALFPALSRSFAGGDLAEFARAYRLAFRQVLFLALPVIVLFVVMPEQIIRVILQTGRFTQTQVQTTAAVLRIFSFGILFQCLIPLVNRAFFAAKNTRVPMAVSVSTVAANIVLAFVFLRLYSSVPIIYETAMKIFGLRTVEAVAILAPPSAFLLTGAAQFFLLSRFVKRYMPAPSDSKGDASIKKTLLAGGAMVGVAVVLARWYGPVLSARGSAFQLVIIGAVGMAAYLVSSFVLKSQELRIIISSVSHQFRHE